MNSSLHLLPNKFTIDVLFTVNKPVALHTTTIIVIHAFIIPQYGGSAIVRRAGDDGVNGLIRKRNGEGVSVD